MKRAEAFFVSIGVASLFLLLILIGAHITISLWSKVRPWYSVRTSYQASAYKHLSNNQIDDLLAWTYKPGWVYEPWLGFKEKARTSTYVNVSDSGIRLNNANEILANKIERAVWFFGGSTTFGYGVADSETIPAQLENLIQQPVVNFGRGYYYSAQENFLLSSLLKSDFKPKAVIFLNGLNERCDITTYQIELSRLFARAQEYTWDVTELVKPLFRIVEILSRKFAIRRDDLHSLECTRYGKTFPLSYVVAENYSERQALCQRYSLECYVFVQPFAGVHHVNQHPSVTPDRQKTLLVKFNHLSSTWRNYGAYFIVDSLSSLHEHAFVDEVHYSASANGLIAKAIANHLPKQY